MGEQSRGRRVLDVLIWLGAAGGLIWFGRSAVMGPFFWFLAIALLVLGPFTSRPRIFRPGVALFVGFLVGFLVMLFTSGRPDWSPTPALVVGGALGVTAAATTWGLQRSKERSRPISVTGASPDSD